MNENDERELFETWISSPPYQMHNERCVDDPTLSSWPGNYRAYQVELAWCAWRERAGLTIEHSKV